MKKITLTIIAFIPLIAFSQTKNKSKAKKSKEPIVTIAKDTLKVEATVPLKETPFPKTGTPSSPAKEQPQLQLQERLERETPGGGLLKFDKYGLYSNK